MESTMNAYAFWQSALKGEKPTGIVDDPQAGFWRLKRGRVWLPVAVWPKGNGLEGAAALGFKIGNEVVGSNMGAELWPGYCANPVTEAVYRAVAERGENWPDADPVVAKILAVTPKQIAGKINSGQQLDPEESARLEMAFEEHAATRAARDPTAEFREQIETALGGVPAYKKIESDEADIRALSLRNLLNDLAANADAARETAKRPHLDAIKEIDGQWMPLVKSARGGAGEIKVARDDWATTKMKAQREAAQRQQDAENEAMVAGKPPAPTPPSNLPPPTPQVRPTFGRASPTSTKLVVTAVDYPKFLAALMLRPEWPTVKAQFEEWAQKLANKGIVPDGVTTEERANTR